MKTLEDIMAREQELEKKERRVAEFSEDLQYKIEEEIQIRLQALGLPSSAQSFEVSAKNLLKIPKT
jgi:hypothetical protein